MIIDVTRWALGFGRRRRSNTDAGAGPVEGSIIGTTDAGQPVTWPRPTLERAGHAVVLASSGAGKTVLVANALVQELLAGSAEAQPQRPALFAIDPKGDLIEGLLTGLAALTPERLADVRYLDPFSDGGFAFNLARMPLGRTPVDIRAMQIASLVSEVSTATGAQSHLGVGARQLDALQHVLLGALTADHELSSVLWALDALTIKNGLKRLARVAASPRARQFLENADLSDELRVSCASRMRSAFAASDALERLVAARDCIRFEDLLAPGRITCLDIGRPIGGLTSLQTFYSNIVARLAIEHLLERPSPFGGHHARLVIDEAQVVAPVLADRAEAILTTGRSRGISLTALSQGTTLIKAASDTLLRVLMTNSPLKLVGRLSAPDAELLSREQAPRAGVEDSISSIRSRFAVTVTNLEDRHFIRLLPGQRDRFVSADVDLAGWEHAAREQQALLDAARGRLALPAVDGARVTLADVVPDERRRAVRRRRPEPAPPARQRPLPVQVPVSEPGAPPPSPEPAGTPPAPNAAEEHPPEPPPRRPRSRWG